MAHAMPWRVTRRNFLAASCGFLLPRVGWAATISQPVLAWSLDRRAGAALAQNSALEAAIIAETGRLEWIENLDQAQRPRLDGYSVWFEDRSHAPVKLGPAFSVSAWVALESYPVNDASVIEWGGSDSCVRLAVDRLGFLRMDLPSTNGQVQIAGKQRLDRGRWIHVAATLSPRGGLSLYVDGAEHARAMINVDSLQIGSIGSVCLGRARNCEVVAKVFPTGVLNGLLREVRVYDQCLSAQEITELAREFAPSLVGLTANENWFPQDTQRPRYHALPPRAWTNEPHGLVYWRGQYHLFYQKNPNGPYWGHIHWGHMTSPDRLKWTEQPIALTPERGPDSEGCWSGSAIAVDDKLHLLYTGGNGKRASICMASSEDGVHFTKYPGNPVIEAPPPGIGVKEFRDPFIWKEGTEYRMIIGSGIEGVGGTALLYASPDLTSWRFLKPLLVGSKESSGVFWEMPVFVRIGDQHVLVVCEVPGRASYWVGRWQNDEFRVLSEVPQRLDLLNHFLSPTPCSDIDGRVVTIGIVPETRDSREAWQAGWAHLYGVPRELTLDQEGRLQQKPLAELQKRFTRVLSVAAAVSLDDDWYVCEAAGSCLRISMLFEQRDSESVTISLRRAPDQQEETLLGYNWQTRQITLDRTKSSLNPHVRRDLQRASYVVLTSGRLALEIFLDESVLEVFVDNRACFSSRIYPALPESVGVALRAEGGIAVLETCVVDTFADV